MKRVQGEEQSGCTPGVILPWIVLALGLVVVMAGGGYWYSRVDSANVRSAESRTLKAVADLDVTQILWLRNDHRADARVVAFDPSFARVVQSFFSHPRDRALKREIRDRLAFFAFHQGYANVMIAGLDGELEFSLDPGPTELEGETRALSMRAISAHDAVIGGIRMDTAAPILAEGGRPIGVLFLQENIAESISPLVQAWPTETRTAETLLVCRDEETALIINELRFKKGTAFTLRFPLSDVRQLAVQAVLGKRGLTDGLNYRGKAAIADIAALPDSNWIMIAMEDRDEVMAVVYSHERFIGFFVAVLTCITGTGVSLLVQRQKKNHSKELFRAESERAEALDLFRTTVYSIGDGVITADAEGKLRHLNRVAETLTGWREEEARGRPVSEVFRTVNAVTHAEVEDPVGCVLREGTVVEMASRALLIARDGQERVIADSGSPIRGSEGEILGVVLVFRDITLKEKLDKELLKIDKLESLSVLASGIAHDFNNILTAVLGNISLTEAELPGNTPIREWIKEAGKACFRAKNLTQQLLTFAKGGAPSKRLCDVGGVIREVASFASHGSAVSCRYEIACDLWPIEVDDGQLGQVVQNMVINSVQAMPIGGTITVAAENVPLAEDNRFLLAPGPYLKITVNDEGVGIPQELLPKIFDPYFTTKESGSGLGLATCYSIVKNHQGHIDVASTPGTGTTFETYLPATADRRLQPRDKRPIEIKAIGKRILVMDDEEPVRRMLKTMLGALGFDSEVAPEGAKAIDLYRDAKSAGRPFDAVIMDLTVPGGIGGEEAIKLLRKLDPAARVIVSSGYSSGVVFASYRAYGFQGILAKPYDLDKLNHVLWDALGE